MIAQLLIYNAILDIFITMKVNNLKKTEIKCLWIETFKYKI